MEKAYRMLLIDDSSEVLDLIKPYFEKHKFEVVSTDDSIEGLRILESDDKGFDIVITDLVMPTMSGIGIISISKKKYPDTIVIAITGYGEHPEELAREAKADAVVGKPIKLSSLGSLVSKLLEKRGSAQSTV